jgi:glutamate/tyrosine decarboxylase-like PLP-dependent enzyme
LSTPGREPIEALLRSAAEHAITYLSDLDDRRVSPAGDLDLSLLGGVFPEEATDPELVLNLLNDVAAPATMAMAGPRFFGWVIGGSHPVGLAADWMVSAWDQNTLFAEATPAAVQLEATALRWIIEAAGLPERCWGAFVTGTTVANMAALSAATNSLLAEAGWDTVNDGLFGAPPVTVVVGEEAHPSLIKALGVVGLGRDNVVRVPVDDQGRMRPDKFPSIDPPAIVCVQAGNVNTGGFDPMGELIQSARERGAWVHVDGAFGFWAATSPRLAHLTDGMAAADSWATDAHKYLNVPYDAGIVLVRNPSTLERVMSVSAAYLPEGEIGRDPLLYTPEMSRRARGVPSWAVLRTLGREGLAELVETTCRLARRFADRLEQAGFEVLNDVVLNQVLVSFGDAEETKRVVTSVQDQGVLFAGPTVWQGKTAMRISVSSWKTTEADVDRSVESIIRCAADLTMATSIARPA